VSRLLSWLFGGGGGMDNAPAIGTVGRTLSVLAPDGQAEFAGASFQVRAREGSIDSGRLVVVTGFDPWSLIVREAASEEAVAHTQTTPLASPRPTNQVRMPHRIGVAIGCLHISAVLYLLIGMLMFLLLVAVDESGGGTPVAMLLLLFCLAMAVGIELVVSGLRRRKFWAWVAGIILFGLYVPSLFLPLGAFGLWGLLDEGSRARFRIDGDPNRG